MPRSAALATTSSDPIELLQQAEVLRRRAEQSFGEYALEAGRLLLQAKRKIPHGSWLKHLEDNTGFSSRTAESYMAARKRWDKLPEAERQGVLEQPFTRSLLVLSQAPKAVVQREALPEPVSDDLLPTSKGRNGTSTSDSIENMLRERAIETTALINQAIEYHPETRESPDDEHEATPLDDILDGPRRTYTDEPSQQAISQEQQEQFEEALKEVERLERENRQLQAQLLESQKSPNQMRGWDFVQSLYQYLRADEPARTPESLARKASTVDGGRETVAYLEQFLAATRNHLSVLA